MAKAFQSERSHDSDAGAVIFRVYVPPGLNNEFMDKWDMYIGKPASKAKGNIKIVLVQPTVSNALHYSYSEWEDMDDFACFYKSKDACDFHDYLAENDIKFEIDFLTRVSGSDQEQSSSKNRKSHIFPVLNIITVKPHHAENFIDVFMDAEQETKRENGNEAYHLSRVVNTNDKFYLYGAWTSEEAWKDHRDSSHVRKLANWAEKHDVVFMESPLMRLGMY